MSSISGCAIVQLIIMCGAVIVILCFVLYIFFFLLMLLYSLRLLFILKMLGNASRSMQPLR